MRVLNYINKKSRREIDHYGIVQAGLANVSFLIGPALPEFVFFKLELRT